MSSVERLAIDISGWQGKRPGEITQDAASFALEAGRRPLEKRINTAAVSVAEFEKLVKNDGRNPEDIATFGVYQWARESSAKIKIWTNSSPPTKNEILDGMFPFTDFNPGKVMVWLSPPLEGAYEESRIIIYQIIEVNNEKYLFLRGLCGNQTTAECLKIAQNLLPFVQLTGNPDKITDREQLRATPLSLLLPPNETYTGFFRQIINLPKVWAVIAQGEDLKEKKRLLSVAEQVVQRYYPLITKARTFDEQLRIGLILENTLARGLGSPLQSGPCGLLYSELSARSLMREVLGVDLLNRRFSAGEGSKFIHNCGACGQSLKRYMSKGDRCPHCGGTYEGC